MDQAPNEYLARDEEVRLIKQSRLESSEQRKEWNYDHQVPAINLKNKTRQQDVEMTHKVGYLDDMKQLIFDPKSNKEDGEFFSSGSAWKMVGFQQIEAQTIESVPSQAYIRLIGSANFGSDMGQIARKADLQWGKVEMEGRLNIKINDTSYNPAFFNLRKRGIFFYSINESEGQAREMVRVQFTQTTFNYQSETEDCFTLKMGEKTLKIRKQNDSKDALRVIQRILFLATFRGTYCLRNQVPSPFLEDYICNQIDTIRGVDFVHEEHLKDIVGSRYYREAIGGFFYLLNKQTFRRKNISGEITFPRWLKSHFRSIPSFDVSLVTNVVPAKAPLMTLKIKVAESQLSLLNESLKSIFPFNRNYMQRTLIVYESSLTDEQAKYMMSQISYPMHTIGLPKNQLSILGLQQVINAANTLYHQNIDCSYNSKLVSVSGSKVFALCNANPSVKKLVLRGCYVMMGEQDQFFQGLSSNMCLQNFEIDFMDNYNEAMSRHLTNYDAQIF